MAKSTVVRVKIGRTAVDIDVTDVESLKAMIKSIGAKLVSSSTTQIEAVPCGEHSELMIVAKLCRIYGLDKRATLVKQARRKT